MWLFDLMSDFSPSVKSCCEMMEVCQDQRPISDTRDAQPVRQPWLSPQASTSTAGQSQHNISRHVLPAWHSRQEHPIILEITSAISSCLSIHEDWRPPEPRQLSLSPRGEKSQPELQLPFKDAQSYTGEAKPVRKRSRGTFEASWSGDR